VHNKCYDRPGEAKERGLVASKNEGNPERCRRKDGLKGTPKDRNGQSTHIRPEVDCEKGKRIGRGPGSGESLGGNQGCVVASFARKGQGVFEAGGYSKTDLEGSSKKGKEKNKWMRSL